MKQVLKILIGFFFTPPPQIVLFVEDHNLKMCNTTNYFQNIFYNFKIQFFL